LLEVFYASRSPFVGRTRRGLPCGLRVIVITLKGKYNFHKHKNRISCRTTNLRINVPHKKASILGIPLLEIKKNLQVKIELK